MWSGRCCSMEIAILVSLIGISFKPLFIESTYLEQVSTFETGSGLDLDLTLAGSNHKRKSAELNLDLSLGNKSYKSNKAPEVSLPAPMRLGSNPLYLSEAGPSRPEYQSLGLTREKYSMISATDSTKRSINEVQPNFYFHTPPNTLNLEKLSALGNNQHNYLHLPQYFWEQPVRMSDGGSNEIEENHRIVYNNFPHKRKFMDENSPEKIATQNQNILHYPIPNGFGTYEISHGKSFNVEDLESQESR
ncbi:hypothetical protein BY996DRAFT_6921316 [Phakopsora pachyrhizi]|nr:hypothetical protein BY996DRAFT_6921316 [Phakopsora pachyrhizi]